MRDSRILILYYIYLFMRCTNITHLQSTDDNPLYLNNIERQDEKSIKEKIPGGRRNKLKKIILMINVSTYDDSYIN